MKHTNNFKRMLAAFSAAAVSATCISFSAFAALEEVEGPPYTVFMSVQAGGESLWEPAETNTATVEGDGSYSVSYVFTDGSASIEACILDSNINAYAYAPEGATDPIAEGSVNMVVDSVTLTRAIDGTVEEVAYNGPSEGAFRVGDNGSSIRYNVLNQWTSPAVTDIDTVLPGEGANEGDTLTVNFTITGLGTEEEEFVIPEGSYYTFMSVQAGAESLWEATEQNTAIFTADGTYTMSYAFVSGSASIEACIIDSNINAYDFIEEGQDPIADSPISMTIDGITLTRALDGTVEEVAYNGPSEGAFRTSDDGASIRYNVLNQWTSPVVTDIDTVLPGEGANEGDVLTVTFTISGLGDSPFSVLYGDVDGDGTIALADATSILSEFASLAVGNAATFDADQIVRADVDGDGEVALADATAVLNYFAAAGAGMDPDPADYFAVLKK